MVYLDSAGSCTYASCRFNGAAGDPISDATKTYTVSPTNTVSATKPHLHGPSTENVGTTGNKADEL